MCTVADTAPCMRGGQGYEKKPARHRERAGGYHVARCFQHRRHDAHQRAGGQACAQLPLETVFNKNTSSPRGRAGQGVREFPHPLYLEQIFLRVQVVPVRNFPHPGFKALPARFDL